MADVQVENGYTKIANEILEEVYKRKFNGTQFRILMCIWRYTYGFQRKEHEMSAKFISEATGLDKKAVKRELNRLVDKHVISIVREASFNQSRILAFNKNYDQWEIDTSVPNDHQGVNYTPGTQNDSSPGGKLTPSPGGKFAPQEIKDKENIKEKDIYIEPYSDFLPWLKKLNVQIRGVYEIEQLESYLGVVDSDLIIESIKRAENKNIPYALTVLENWINEGKTRVADLEEFRKKKRGAYRTGNSRDPTNRKKVPKAFQEPDEPDLSPLQAEPDEELKRMLEELETS